MMKPGSGTSFSTTPLTRRGESECLERSSYLVGKHHVAKIAFQLEQSLDSSESIIQVHDYSNDPGGAGIQHTFDVTIFNSSTTQALTKRIQCLEKGNSVEIVSEQIMSPITGSIMTQKDILDDVHNKYLFVTWQN